MDRWADRRRDGRMDGWLSVLKQLDVYFNMEEKDQTILLGFIIQHEKQINK